MRFLLALSLLLCFVFLGGISARHHSSSSVSPLFSAIPDYRDYTFERFEMEYGKKYHSALSRENHKRTFYENLHKITHHNAHLSSNGKTYFLKINQYADLSEEIIKQKFTGRSKAVAANKHSLKNMIKYTTPKHAVGQALPDAVDWRNKGAVTPVKDQGGCGSCWAHAAVESIESAFTIATKSQVILSPQHILECTPNPNKCGGTGGCEGATAELAFEWAKNGVATEATVPYKGVDAACPVSVPKAVKVGGWVKLPENEAEPLLEAVAFIGPISISVDASAWSFYGGGVFNGCNNVTNPDINHGVQLVGYGRDDASNEKYWLVRNSWGTSWGENGYIRIFRNDTVSCGWDTHPQDGTACEGQTEPVKVCGACGIFYDTSYPTDVTRF